MDNARAGALYRKARIGLNLYRATGGAPAESLNPRAYELAADGVFTVAQPRAEQTERLGGSVATFTTPGELEERIRTHLADAWRRRAHGRGAARPGRRRHLPPPRRPAGGAPEPSRTAKEHGPCRSTTAETASCTSAPRATTTASRVLTMTAWTMDRSTERMDVTNFDSIEPGGDAGLAGAPRDVRGLLEHGRDQAVRRRHQSPNGVQGHLLPHPPGCPPSTSPCTAWLDASIETRVDGVTRVRGTYSAYGSDAVINL